MKNSNKIIVALVLSFITFCSAVSLTFAYFLSNIILTPTTTVDDQISIYFNGGTGETNTPYLIHTEQQYRAFVNFTNRGYFDSFTNFRLTNDIEFSDTYYQPIGSEAFPFEGYFDGGGHKLTNINVSSKNAQDIGVFGYIGYNGVVDNLLIINPTIANVDAADTDYASYDATYTSTVDIASDSKSLVVSTNAPRDKVIKTRSSNLSILSDRGTAVAEGNAYISVYLEGYDINGYRFQKVIDKYYVTIDASTNITEAINTYTYVDNNTGETITNRYYEVTEHGTNIGLFCGHLDGNASYVGVQGGKIIAQNRLLSTQTGLVGRENQEKANIVRAGNKNRYHFNFNEFVYNDVFNFSSPTACTTTTDANGDLRYECNGANNYLGSNKNENGALYWPGQLTTRTTDIFQIKYSFDEGAIRIYNNSVIEKTEFSHVTTPLYTLNYSGSMGGYTTPVFLGIGGFRLYDMANGIWFKNNGTFLSGTSVDGYVKVQFKYLPICDDKNYDASTGSQISLYSVPSSITTQNAVFEQYEKGSNPYTFNICDPSLRIDIDEDGVIDDVSEAVFSLDSTSGAWADFTSRYFFVGLSQYAEGQTLKILDFDMYTQVRSGNTGGNGQGNLEGVNSLVDYLFDDALPAYNNGNWEWPAFSNVNVFFDMRLNSSGAEPTSAELAQGLTINFARQKNTNGSYYVYLTVTEPIHFTFYQGVCVGIYKMNNTDITTKYYT